MENKRIKINEVLIFYTGIFILFSFRINDVAFVFLRPVQYIILGGFVFSELISYIPYFVLKDKKYIENKVNIFNGFALFLVFLAVLALNVFVFFFLFLLGVSYKYPTTIESIVSLLVVTAFSILLFIVSLRMFRRSHLEYHKIGYSFLTMNYAIFAVNLLILGVFFMESFLFVKILVVLPSFIFMLLGTLYICVALFNSFTNNKFYNVKTGLKVFSVNIFKRRLAYYFGVALTFFMGFVYLIAGFLNESIFYQSIGFVFFTIAILRIIDQLWIVITSNKNKKIRYLNQYILIFINAGILILVSFFIKDVLLLMEDNKSLKIDFFIGIQAIIIIVKVIMSILGYYKTRINVKKEPYNIALNNMSIVSTLIALYGFSLPILVNVGIDVNSLGILFESMSYSIFGLINLLLTIMIIRGIVGLIKIKKLS